MSALHKEATLKPLLSMLPGHLYWKNTEGEFLGCNYEQVYSLGFSDPEDLIGLIAYDTLPKEQSEEIFETGQEIMCSEKSLINEEVTTLFRREESIIPSQKKSLKNEKNQVVGIAGMSLEISESFIFKKNLEGQLEEKNKELKNMLDRYEEFVSNQEHEMLTPYTGMFDASELLIETLEGGSGPEVEFFAKSIPNFLFGDIHRLRNYSVGLLSSAVKHTESEEINLSFYRKKTEKENEDLLDIQVEDTGLDIEEGKLEMMFEPFVRLTLSNVRKYEGRGVRLTFVKKW